MNFHFFLLINFVFDFVFCLFQFGNFRDKQQQKQDKSSEFKIDRNNFFSFA